MEEKINNQKIFSYVPSLIARLILNSNLQDRDIFADTNADKKKNFYRTRPRGKSTFLTSIFIKPNIYPINHDLSDTIVMNIRLKGFQKLISTLSLKDPRDTIEKMVSEYLSIITPNFLLKISEIILKNGGEIIKYNDYEFTTVWNFTPKRNKIPRYKKFYAKQAIITAYEIMKELNDKEIADGIYIKICIGIAMGKTTIGFFGGERKRGEYIVMGEAIQNAEICLNYCLSHETIISEEINAIFDGSEEIETKEINNNENLKIYLITNFNEKLLKNFRGFKIRMKYDKLNMTKILYENLAKKVYVFSSILPQGLVKYLDVGQDKNLKEISVVTIATIHLLINQDMRNNYKIIQNIILDIQKATYLTFGSLLYISKTYNGLLIRCVWGMDPGSFLDDTARCISTSILIGSLTDYYDIKIGIGISTGSCYTGLIPIQGDKKQFTLLGKKVNLSRTLADEAFQKIIKNKTDKRYVIYCDKKTMEQSQKWFRHIYVSTINIFFNKESDELYYETKENNDDNANIIQSNSSLNFSDNSSDQETKTNYEMKLFKRKKRRLNSCLFGEYNRVKKEKFQKENNKNNSIKEDSNIISLEIYSPIEHEEYFLQNENDLFPLLRTHKHNSYSPKIKYYFQNHFKSDYSNRNIDLNLICNLPMPNSVRPDEQNKMYNKFTKSQVIYGYEKEIDKFVYILNQVTKKNLKQVLLIKGSLGVGKSLFLRNALTKYIESNKKLKKIYLNESDFIFFNSVDPLTATFPYNIFCFILRKLFFHIKKIDKLKEIHNLIEELNLDNENIKCINFVLSMGKKDIDIREGFKKDSKDRDITRIRYFNERSFMSYGSNESISYISELEGPHKVKDSNKLNYFFLSMIKIYKMYLNEKYDDLNEGKIKKSSHKKKKKIPLILVFEDIQMSDRFSIDLIKNLFNYDENCNNPFIIILVEQTPFNKNYRPILHRELEFFLTLFNESDDENENIGNNKIITFNINSIMEKDILKDIIIENFNNYIIKNYPGSTKIEYIDDKILDFLLMKTFQGIPLLVISLFESLLKNHKYIEFVDNKFKITDELIDDNELFDWSNLVLPYIYEKITSMTINSLLSFKELLLLKYACTIGTIFDVQTLNKINPLNLIIKKEDLYNIMEKLNNEYIIETYENDRTNRRSKKFLICKICFPFMREVLHQKFPISRRASLHAETAKLLSGGKKVFYFNSKIEGKILNRHLIYSEINVVEEIESKTSPDKPNSYNNNQIMNTNNLTVLLVKDIYSKIFDTRSKNVIDGNLEFLYEDQWIKVFYYVDRQWKIHFKKVKDSEDEADIEVIIPIKDILKNNILENNILEITITEYSFYLLNEERIKVKFRSNNWLDIFNLNTALTFLKMITIYQRYIYDFGYTKFPLYKTTWYERKEKKYYVNIDQNRVYYLNNFKPFRKKRLFSSFGLVNQTDKVINESKNIIRPFSVIMKTALSIIIANIQIHLGKNSNGLNSEENEQGMNNGKGIYLFYVKTPKHVKMPINSYLKEVERIQKEEEELLKLKSKVKYSLHPFSLMKHERRIFGSGILEERRNQSISHPCTSLININNSNIIEEKEEEDKDIKTKQASIQRKNEKSRTIFDKIDIPKEIKSKIKGHKNFEKEGNNIDDISKIESRSISQSKSEESEEEKKSINFTQTESDTSSLNSSDNIADKKKKSSKDLTKIKNENPLEDDKKNNVNNNNIDNNKTDNKNDINDNKKKIDDSNVNNKNDKNNINNDNEYKINNYINNNININLINNNYLNSSLKDSFFKKKVINNNLNINIDSLRLSFNKMANKAKQKLKQKKSNSVKVKSLKEKFRNSINYLNSKNRISLDEDEESITSDKESENNDENKCFSPLVKHKKKNSKILPELIPPKEDIFSKTVLAFLTDENAENKEEAKKILHNSTFKIKLNSSPPKNSNIDGKTLKNKRTSLCPAIKFQNKLKHVKFTQNDGVNKTFYRKNTNPNIRIRSSLNTKDKEYNNIRRVGFPDSINDKLA